MPLMLLVSGVILVMAAISGGEALAQSVPSSQGFSESPEVRPWVRAAPELLVAKPPETHPEVSAFAPARSLDFVIPAGVLRRVYDTNGLGDCAPQPLGGMFVPQDWSRAGQFCLKIAQDRANAAAARQFPRHQGVFGVAPHPAAAAQPTVLTDGATTRVLEQSLHWIADGQGSAWGALVRGRVEFNLSLFGSGGARDTSHAQGASENHERDPRPRYVVVYEDQGKRPESAPPVAPKVASLQGGEAHRLVARQQAALQSAARGAFEPLPLRKRLVEVREGEETQAQPAKASDAADLGSAESASPGFRESVSRRLGLGEPIFTGLRGRIERDPSGNLMESKLSVFESAGSIVFAEVKPLHAGGALRSVSYGLGLPFGPNRASFRSFLSEQPTAIALERRLAGTAFTLVVEPRPSVFKFEAQLML